MNKPSKNKAEIEAEKLDRLARWPTVESERDYRDRVDEESFDIISRMEATQQRFGRPVQVIQTREGLAEIRQDDKNERRLQLEDRADWIQDGDPPALAGESEADYNERTGRYDEHMVEGTLSNFDRYIAGDR